MHNTKNQIVLIQDQVEFTYFKDSQQVKVRFLPTGEAAPFTEEELHQFLSLVHSIMATEPLHSILTMYNEEVNSNA